MLLEAMELVDLFIIQGWEGAWNLVGIVALFAVAYRVLGFIRQQCAQSPSEGGHRDDDEVIFSQS